MHEWTWKRCMCFKYKCLCKISITWQVPLYRFSIAWSRIYPKGYGEINQAGVDFYNNFIDALLEIGVVPLVTLYHWDLPQGLDDFGGWLNVSTTDAYAIYADTCFGLFGDRVCFIYLSLIWLIYTDLVYPFTSYTSALCTRFATDGSFYHFSFYVKC